MQYTTNLPHRVLHRWNLQKVVDRRHRRALRVHRVRQELLHDFARMLVLNCGLKNVLLLTGSLNDLEEKALEAHPNRAESTGIENELSYTIIRCPYR